MMGGRDLTPEQLRVSLVGEGTVRLSVGLEDTDDLIEDIRRALDIATRT
jgi:cystathionine beta-lyase/cystathionine gamma-synthase